MAGGVPGGVVGGVVGGLPGAPPPPAPMRGAEALDAMSRVEAAAQGRELGDLFEYRLKEPVTIRKNQSALVPIINAQVEAERVSVWNASTGQRPRSAVWLTNATPYTLDGGAFSVLEEATFTGEGLMDPVKPGEKRLLSYAADLALLVDARQDAADPERVTSLRIARGVMIMQRELREKRTYTVRNEDSKARTRRHRAPEPRRLEADRRREAGRDRAGRLPLPGPGAAEGDRDADRRGAARAGHARTR